MSLQGRRNRKRSIRLLSLLLSVVLLVGLLPVSAFADMGLYLPVEWRLDEIYTGYGHWRMEYDRAMELIGQYDRFRGTLNTAENIYRYIEYAYLSELTRLQGRLLTYASLGHDLNPVDPDFSTMLSLLDSMAVEETVATAFVDEEIYSLSPEERERIFADPIFDGIRYAVRDYTAPGGEPVSEELLQALAVVSLGQGYAEKIYTILDTLELPNPEITMPDGRVLPLTEELYDEILYSAYDEAFLEEATRLYLTRAKGFANTFAALLEENASQAWAGALLNGYDTTREAAMAEMDLDPVIYDLLTEAAHEGAEDYQRYLRAHADALDVGQQRTYDIGLGLSDFDPGWMSYEQAAEDVLEALEVLGGEYTGKYLAILQSGHVDVYPAETKISGSYEVQYDPESLPWVLLNFSGRGDDAGTVAHEMGHAVYDAWAAQYQNPLFASPTVFTQEIASTTNELIYYTYKMNNARSDSERLYYLEELLGMFTGTFFTQMLYAEFEDELYRTVESGAALNADSLSETWAGLWSRYCGDTVSLLEDQRFQWTTIPHFYYVYYVWQYASSVCYAASIAERITEGDPEAVTQYTDFLKQGASDSPMELLKTAGIDPLSEETYAAALAWFSGLVDEYETLIRK